MHSRFGSPKFENLGTFQFVTYKHRAVGVAIAAHSIYLWANQFDFADFAIGAPIKAA
jgi:hypothetical protein